MWRRRSRSFLTFASFLFHYTQFRCSLSLLRMPLWLLLLLWQLLFFLHSFIHSFFLLQFNFNFCVYIIQRGIVLENSLNVQYCVYNTIHMGKIVFVSASVRGKNRLFACIHTQVHTQAHTATQGAHYSLIGMAARDKINNFQLIAASLSIGGKCARKLRYKMPITHRIGMMSKALFRATDTPCAAHLHIIKYNAYITH